MCTIGNVFSTEKGNVWNSVFKQCDLIDSTTFMEPQVCNLNEIRYVPFTRQKSDGTTPAWAGVNEYGVSFVAADSYLKKRHSSTETETLKDWNRRESVLKTGETVFDMYLGLITRYKNAGDAVRSAEEWYRKHLHKTHATDSNASDILLVADGRSAYFVEAKEESPHAVTVVTIRRDSGFFCSTNHMRMIYGAQPYEENHSTYLRLQRAEAILQTNPSRSGVGELLRDTYYGESVWSICRSKTIRVDQETPFYTQASVLIDVERAGADKPRVMVEYVLNGNPSPLNAAQIWAPFTSSRKETIPYIGSRSLYE
jgi:hypothetical protein